MHIPHELPWSQAVLSLFVCSFVNSAVSNWMTVSNESKRVQNNQS